MTENTAEQELINSVARQAQREHHVTAYGQSSVDGWYCTARTCSWEASGNAHSAAQDHVAEAIAAAVVRALDSSRKKTSS